MSIWKQNIVAIVSVFNLAKNTGVYISFELALVCCSIPLAASPRSLLIFHS